MNPAARYTTNQISLDWRAFSLSEDAPFFFKQWGGVNKKRNRRDLEGRVWDEMPEWDA